MGLVEKLEKIFPRDEPFFGFKSAALEYSIWGVLFAACALGVGYSFVKDKIEAREFSERISNLHYHNYRVKSGEYLDKIAKKFIEEREAYPRGKLIEAIQEENGISNPNVINAGEYILLPCDNSDCSKRGLGIK